MGYKLKLEMFEGPLDLLLYLIKKNEIDIYDIPIVEITDQYLEYIEMMRMLDLDVVGDFLVMAATLIQIKSKMLLPEDPSEEEGEEVDPRDELVRRLEEYKRYKEVAEELKQREMYRRDLFPRQWESESLDELKEDAKEYYFEASLFDLMNALSTALNTVPKKKEMEVEREEFTVSDKIHNILHLLVKEPKVMLMDLFGQASSRGEVIVIFMAVLELIRLKEVKIQQKRIFADIEVIRNEEKMNAPVDPEAVVAQVEENNNESPSPEATEEPSPEESEESEEIKPSE